MDITTIQHALAGSYGATLTFPQVVQQLLEAGVERYHVDLIRHETIYYDAAGHSHRETHPPVDLPPVNSVFDAGSVQNSIRAVQRGESNYIQFLQRIMSAGTSDYVAYLTGRQVIYSGRSGDFHIEPFPQP